MAAKVATMFGPTSPHSAGIFADRNLDGPEIGTLVVVVDRAKNLPNLRTMGKQDPYCALRLGKEAKKTETDRRGGQTPRWDQELRFVVHESLDYTKLKLSVFNEDKRTDLIGETFISLDNVLLRGGGQADAWHELNAKGKYAGQIRIELTFYDIRPKEQRPVAEVNDYSFPVQGNNLPNHTSRQVGPRQQPPVKRRPLPSMDASTPPQPQPQSQLHLHQRANSIPLPPNQPRSYHTPPRQSSYPLDHASAEQTKYHTPSPLQFPHSSPSSEQSRHPQALQQYESPQHGYSQQDEPQDFNDEDDAFPYTDDPWALQSVEADKDSNDPYSGASVAPLRHDRVQQLASRPPPRPTLANGIPHAHSAPALGPHEQVFDYSHQDSEPHQDDLYEYQAHTDFDMDVAPLQYGQATRPPPPPSHRNSAPAIQQLPNRPVQAQMQPQMRTTGYRRPQPAAYHPAMHDAEQEDNYQSFSDAPQPRRQADYHYESTHSHESQPLHVAQQEPYHQQQAYPHNAVFNQGYGDMRIQSHPDQRQRQGLPAPRPHSQMVYSSPRGMDLSSPASQDATFRESGVRPPLVKPRAISPGAPAQRPQQAVTRKSVSPNAAPFTPPHEPTSATMAYSPDSFAAFNPHAQQHSSSAHDDRLAHTRDPKPMYASPDAAQPPRNPEPEPTTSHGPIVGSDGRIIDPSDHLPSSTYAPEPEPKGNDRPRANLTATVKTRFGPREARSSPISVTTRSAHSTPALSPASSAPPSSGNRAATDPSAAAIPSPTPAARNRLQKRNPDAANVGSSPLAPSAPGAINGRLLPVPPPVPGKIPLDAYEPEQQQQQQQQQHHHHRGHAGSLGSMAALSREMAQIDIGPNPGGEQRYGGVGGRPRRSRFGA